MPNSPMPMLDVCDWLLLMTVSKTGGGTRLAPFLFCGLSLLPPGCFPWPFCWGSIIVMGVKPPLLMAVGVEKLCCVCLLCWCWSASSVVLNEHSLYVLCTIVRILFLVRAGRIPFEWPPWITYRCVSDVRSVPKKLCGCCQQPREQ